MISMEQKIEVPYDYLQYDDAEKTLQLRHRAALINLWAPSKGDHVLMS